VTEEKSLLCCDECSDAAVHHHCESCYQDELSRARKEAELEADQLRDAKLLLEQELSEAAKALRFSWDEETGYEVPAESEPKYAESFAEACALFMDLLDQKENHQ
jgi:hypothetical protein